ncbi:MAG: glycosyltransferase family 4 protein, partial [Nitrososphaerales archaeon]
MRLLINVNVAWFLISHRLGVARAARDAGFEVHVAADVDSADEATSLEREGFHFHRVRLGRGSLRPGDDLSYL